MALKGINVLEFVGLAPAPFCGKILADFGATVTRIDKNCNNHLDVLQHGKRTVGVNLKDSKGQLLIRRFATQCDVLIEPFRPGVMEKNNLGPESLCKLQPRLIYARLTGFGQSGRLAKRAGHDINYAAISGVLSMLGGPQKPTPPINLLADFAGGGLMCALGICLALLERHNSGHGQVIDAAMIDGVAYVASWLTMSQSLPLWGKERGSNLLDGGAYFYDTYKTKDGKFMSVGALEPQFFEIFKTRLGIPQLSQYLDDNSEHEAMRVKVKETFLQKTQDEWTRIFEDVDACVYPVLDWDKAMNHDHNRVRDNFDVLDGVIVPKPAPRLSRTPGKVQSTISDSDYAEHVFNILKDFNITENETEVLIKEHVLIMPMGFAKL